MCEVLKSGPEAQAQIHAGSTSPSVLGVLRLFVPASLRLEFVSLLPLISASDGACFSSFNAARQQVNTAFSALSSLPRPELGSASASSQSFFGVGAVIKSGSEGWECANSNVVRLIEEYVCPVHTLVAPSVYAATKQSVFSQFLTVLLRAEPLELRCVLIYT